LERGPQEAALVAGRHPGPFVYCTVFVFKG
jgi:uncharacterized membrane protein